MKNKYLFVSAMLVLLLAACVSVTGIHAVIERDSAESRTFRVVASFYPMYIAAENIIGGCDGVSLTNLSEPQTGCLHDYQLTSADMRKLSGADLFIVNGGGIESFLSEVAKQYPGLAVIQACEKVSLLDGNAHAWMSIADYMTQVQTIADGLAAHDSAHAGVYEANCRAYVTKLRALQKEQQDLAKAHTGLNLVVFHEAFAYFARDFASTVSFSLDLDEERQVSAGEVAQVVSQVRDNGVRLILAEELYGRKMCETVQKEADVSVAYLDPCVRGPYEADGYLRAMEGNIEQMRRFYEGDL